MSFCEKLRMIRMNNNLSQEMLADKLYISRQTVSKWESGLSYPEIDKLITISNMFNVSIDYLLKDTQIDTVVSESLDRLVIQFLGSTHKLTDLSQMLIDIMEDGIIDEQEKLQLEGIVDSLDRISENIISTRNAIVKSCRGTDDENIGKAPVKV